MTAAEGVMEGAEAFELGDGPVGILLIHGFTGSPQSLRLWGEALATQGFRVSCPRLPGHGTRWEDMSKVKWTDWIETAQDGLDSLVSKCRTTFIAGLSMGGAITMYLAAENQDAVEGVVTVGASLYTRDIRLIALPILKYLVDSLPGIANDVADPAQTELAYDRLPLKALAEFIALQGEAQKRLERVTAPALLFHSRQDQVVDPGNMAFIAGRLGSDRVTMRWLEKSYHVATLDFDRAQIFEESARFFSMGTE